MSQHRVRAAVAGAGVFGRNHLRVIRESAGAELAGVYDIDREKTARAAEEFGCRAFKSLEDLAANADAAIVAVPTVAHREVACRLIEAGLDLLVEKPIAASVAESRAMVDAARERGRILQAGHLERYNPAVAAANRLRTVPLFFEIHRLSVFTPRSLDVDVVADLMIHDLDILLSMTGEMPDEVRAAGISVLSGKVDIASVRLGFPNGCVANLTASRVSTERVRKLRFFQPGEYISVDYARQDCLRIGVGADRQFRIEPQPVEKEEPLKRQFAGFLESMEKRSTPLVDGEAATRALEVACEITARMAEHGEVVARTLRNRV